MSRYPTYSYSYSPQPPSLSSIDFYSHFHHDNDSNTSVNHTKTSPYPSPNPPPYFPRGTNSTSKPKNPTEAMVGDEKAIGKMQNIPINSPAIQSQLPAHYRHNDFECQHGHRQDGGQSGLCPYMFHSSSTPFHQGNPEYEYENQDSDTHKPCHRSPHVHRILIPLFVMLSIVAGIFVLNACLVSSGAIASWGHWDWKGIGEWRGSMSDDGLVGSDTGVVTEYLTHGAVKPHSEHLPVPAQALPGGEIEQLVSHGQPLEAPLQPSLGKRAEESAFTKHKLYLVVIFVGLLVVIILAVMLSAWCCQSAFENPCCCPCYLCACCGGLACLECIGCGLCCEGIQELAED